MGGFCNKQPPLLYNTRGTSKTHVFTLPHFIEILLPYYATNGCRDGWTAMQQLPVNFISSCHLLQGHGEAVYSLIGYDEERIFRNVNVEKSRRI